MTKVEHHLISRPESTALKGLLMILIVTGHLRGIANDFQMYLYCFHVQCFFILPFLYPAKPLTQNNILNLGLKLLWPYLLLYAFQIILSIYVFHDSYFIKSQELMPGINNIVLGLWSVITGGINLIDKYCGTQFLWFLPCFFSMIVIRMYYNEYIKGKFQKVVLCVIGIICYIVYSTFAYNNSFIPEEFIVISQSVSPFSVLQGLGYFVLGMSVVYLIKRIKYRKEYIYWGIVLILTVIYILWSDSQIIFRLLRFVFPVFFFLAVYYSRAVFCRIKLLHAIGARSLAIYLIHPFLCILVGLLLPKDILSNPIVLCMEFVVVLFLSYILAVVIERIPTIRKLLFPRGEEIGLIIKKNTKTLTD